MRRTVVVLVLAVSWIPLPAGAQARDSADWQEMSWRLVGPFRGGRVTAVAGVPQRPDTFFHGAAGGGVWRTDDAGTSWRNVSDGYFGTASVGAVAVAPSDPDVVWAGTGEGCVRGVATSSGDGVYRSDDGGRSWRHLGLTATRHVPAIRVHPDDPDTVWVAAQGDPWSAGPDRGVFRTRDGGASWQHVLAVGPDAGAADLALDATNPRVLLAAIWQHHRRPWEIRSGGPASAIYRSRDGGDSWERLAGGLPDALGKAGVAISPADPTRMWAIVEAGDGGLYRSDDGGDSWHRVSSERRLWTRSWYYMHVVADPADEDTVWVLNADLLLSEDGGATFIEIDVPHGDTHALWIHPDRPDRIVNGNDGGACVSLNRGSTWTSLATQPTGQFYRVAVDRATPYRIYSAQQDNSSISIPSRSPDRVIDRRHWHPVGGCESGHVAFDPDDPTTVFAGCYLGQITVWDRGSRTDRLVMAYSGVDLGLDPRDAPYRFNWNAPIVVSPHDPATVYHAANVVLRSRDRGLHWDEISPDLTRDDPSRQGPGGGPHTNEMAGGETYGTLLALAESPHRPGELWAGSDDGLVHRTRDGGGTWTDVTPAGLGEAMVNTIEISPHAPDAVYVAATAYRFGDRSPMVWRTTDGGRSWTRRDAGLDAFVRAVRADPVRPGLLYAATEGGVAVSFDDGGAWQSLQLDLPVVPVTDLAVTAADLVASTEGRALWVLDDVTPLRASPRAGRAVDLLPPRDVFHWPDAAADPTAAGRNPAGGAVLDYVIAREPPPDGPPLRIEILDPSGARVRMLDGVEELDDDDREDAGGDDGLPPLPTGRGHHRLVWDLRSEPLPELPGVFVYSNLDGPAVPPGRYTARLVGAGDPVERVFEVGADPRLPAVPAEERSEHRRLVSDLDRSLRVLHRAAAALDEVRGRLLDLATRRSVGDPLADDANRLAEAISDWEAGVLQLEQETYLDEIAFPNLLQARMLELLRIVDGAGPPVTEGMRRRWSDLEPEWRSAMAAAEELLGPRLEALNRAAFEERLPAVAAPELEW